MKAVDQAMGKEIIGASDQGDEFGVSEIALTLKDGSCLVIRGRQLSAELQRPAPRKLTLRERVAGTFQP